MCLDVTDPWPVVFELSPGEMAILAVGTTMHRVTLRAVEHRTEPDAWIADNPTHRTLCEARVTLEVDGVEVTLLQRPYELPVEVSGLRLYVESTRRWATEARLEVLHGVEKDVRLSVRPAGCAWGPETLRFPILNYRWRSAAYANTWSALVPYNLLYYHRGDDFGAIPDRLPVIAAMDSVVTESPVPVARASNSVCLQTQQGFSIRYAHMNIETIDPALVPGAVVRTGQVLGRTGCTWNGTRSQWADPHLHVAFALNGRAVSSYPFLVEAYLRDYPDAVLPVAGGYTFACVGDEVCLDGSRSVARPGARIRGYGWRLHDGRRVPGAMAHLRYAQPGQYAEELVVTAEDGTEGRDFAHVRVYDPEGRRDFAYGWAYAFPVRGVKVGVPVLFWNRLLETAGPVQIDFGDGSPVAVIAEATEHAYDAPGGYVVTLSGYGRDGHIAMVKLSVEVEA